MGVKEKIRRLWNTMFVPTSIKPIKFVLQLENLLSIYRNIGYYKKKTRYFICLRVFLDIMYTIACIVTYAMLALPASKTIVIIYFYMNGVNSIIILSLAIYFSKKFKRLLKCIEDNHMIFTNDKEYQRNMIKRDSIIKYGFLISNIMAFFVYVCMNVKNLYNMNDMGQILVFILNARMCDYRCMFEHVAVYSLLCVMSAQVDCITRAVSEKKVATANIPEEIGEEINNERGLELKDFEEMFTVFSNIKNSSELFNEIFGVQLVLMLASATTYCILFLYNMAFLSVKGFHDLIGFIASVFRLLTFFLPLLLVSWSAQQKLNNLNDLRRRLGKLLIDCETNDAYYKATKGFLRLVSTRSIQTKTFGSIHVDMTLIPSFIMFVTSYTVIALQFNNIV